MESIAATLISVTATPIGVAASNLCSRAVMKLKIDELTSSKPTSSSRTWPRSDATLSRFREELPWGRRSRPASPCCWQQSLSCQSLGRLDCHTTNETY